jgi:hypothetical protein
MAAIRVINASPHEAKTIRPNDQRLVCLLVDGAGALRAGPANTS